MKLPTLKVRFYCRAKNRRKWKYF